MFLFCYPQAPEPVIPPGRLAQIDLESAANRTENYKNTAAFKRKLETFLFRCLLLITLLYL